MQSYAGSPVVAFAPEMWNGSLAQCNSFISATGITYPMLRNAGSAGLGSSYSVSWDVSFVIDAEGLIVYRANGFNRTAVEAAIDAALDAMTTDVPNADAFRLHAARPNPFNPSTTIAWTMDDASGTSRVRVDIHDVRGRRLTRLLDGDLAGGREHSVRWDGTDASGRIVESGTYIATVEVDGRRQSRFLTLVK